MNEKQKELLQRILKMKVGTVLKKGNQRRILLGIAPGFIVYSTPSRPKQKNFMNVQIFMKWAEKAEVEEKTNDK